MRKQIGIFLTMAALLMTFHVRAENIQPTEAGEEKYNPYDFHLSAKEQFGDPNEERSDWLPVLSNETGYYLANGKSITVPEPSPVIAGRKDVYQIRARSVFLQEKLVAKLGEVYAKYLEPEEKIGYCDMLLYLDRDSDEYRIMQTEIYTREGRLVLRDESEKEWRKAPQESFVKSLFHLIHQYSLRNQP